MRPGIQSRFVIATLSIAMAACGDSGSTETPDAAPADAAAPPDAAPPDAAAPRKTDKLEAAKTAAEPDTAFWDKADYLELAASSTAGNGSLGQAYGGEYNM